MSIRVTRPFGMRLLDWADQISYDIDAYGPFGKLEREEDWQDWAANIFRSPGLPANLPIPYAFKDWQEWAELFCKTVEA